MPESEQARSRSRRTEQEQVEDLAPAESAQSAEHRAELDSEVDSLLSEIDDVLESNAEEFVRSFLQKGGQ
jgi:prokaryotic ubiquitin-like protein Pup